MDGSLFIEQVYSEAILSGRGEYLLVGDFDHERTMDFPDCYGWGEQEKEIVWQGVGGKPVSLYAVPLAVIDEWIGNHLKFITGTGVMHHTSR